MSDDNNDPVYTQIYDYVTLKGIKMSWLADNLSVSRQYLSLALKGERSISDERIKQINMLLGTDFKKPPELLPHEKLAQDRQSLEDKPLFKDDK
jgi:transcriptional regulator with XRE-family HTH domain